jgi:hypothetical protein
VIEDVVRERIDDRELAASLDGLGGSRVLPDGPTGLNVTGAFWTLQSSHGHAGEWMLPMEARFSLDAGAVSVIRVATREGLFEPGSSERQFQRALADAVWQPGIELQLT